MIIKAINGKAPSLAPSVRLAENAAVLGDVTIGEDSSVWYGAVIRGDAGPITIGKACSIQDNVTIHNDARLADGVVVGHNAVIHGCIVEENSLIGMGAVVLDDAVVGRGSVVGAGCVVTKGTVIPPHSLVLGVPGKVVRTDVPGLEESTAENSRKYVLAARAELILPETGLK